MSFGVFQIWVSPCVPIRSKLSRHSLNPSVKRRRTTPPPFTDTARHLPLTFFPFYIFFPSVICFKWVNAVLSQSSNNLNPHVFLAYFWKIPSSHQEVICFRDYCTCVVNWGGWGWGRGWAGQGKGGVEEGKMLRNATVNSSLRSIKMYLMVQTYSITTNY